VAVSVVLTATAGSALTFAAATTVVVAVSMVSRVFAVDGAADTEIGSAGAA